MFKGFTKTKIRVLVLYSSYYGNTVIVEFTVKAKKTDTNEPVPLVVELIL
ncbi:hypothetical protein UT300016_24800 [Clostridium senegalense]